MRASALAEACAYRRYSGDVFIERLFHLSAMTNNETLAE